MVEDDDISLLNLYTLEGSEEAFSELLKRHMDLVYSTALRHVHSSALAQDVVQLVFLELTQWTGRLGKNKSLSPWLYRVTCTKAIDLVRAEARRKQRESAAAEMEETNRSSESWSDVKPLLDRFMVALGESDRAALLVRFFENQSLKAVGQALGVSEDAAQKRVSRAIDKLRSQFLKNGVSLSSPMLATLLSENAVQSAPIELTSLVTKACLSGSATTVSTIVMTSIIKKTLTVSAVAIVAGFGVSQFQELEGLKKQISDLKSEILELEIARDVAVDGLDAKKTENARLRQQIKEIPKLRGDVARLSATLKARARTLTESEIGAEDLIGRVSALKEHFDLVPEHWIPELDLVSEEEWMVAATGELDHEGGLRAAMSKVRRSGENRLAHFVTEALDTYLKDHDDVFPQSLSSLRAYLDAQVTNEMLQRWQIVSGNSEAVSGFVVDSDKVITQKTAVDELFDFKTIIIGRNMGIGGTEFFPGQHRQVLISLYEKYRTEHGDSLPKSPRDLEIYAESEEEKHLVDLLHLRASVKNSP